VRHLVPEAVVGVRERLADQLADVVVGERVVDERPLAPVGDQPGEAQLRQVLADRGRAGPGQLGEAGDRRLALHQRPQDVEPRRVGEHAQRVGGPPDVVRLGARVERVEQEDGSAAVVVDGRRIRADAVVAADGIRSPIRQQLVGADDPVFSGTVVYRGLVPREDVLDLHPDAVNRYWLGPYRHGVVYWLSGGRTLAVNAAVQHAEWAEESWTAEAPPDELLAYLEGWDPKLRERVRRCTTLLRGAVFVRRPLEHWTFGRVTLLGDAAHAMEPWQAQGAAQAIEDAFVLGECLGAAGGDVQAGLRRYEHVRMARATELQESSARAGNVFYLPDGEEQQRRDAEYATLHERLPWGHRQKLWEYDVRDALA